jgi:hypothetical protein
MTLRLMGLSAALLLAAPLAANAPAPRPAPAPDSALALGTVIASGDNVSVSGWRELWQADYVTRAYTPGSDVIESSHCCIRVFGKGNAMLVLKTDPVSRGPDGKPLTERVQRRLWVTKRPGEIFADCEIFWITTQLSLVDEKTDTVRSVVFADGELQLFSWRGSGSHCAFGDQ